MKNYKRLLTPLALALPLFAMAPSLAAADDDMLEPRLRFGMHLGGGAFLGDAEGGLGGGDIQLGVRFNELVSIYYQGFGLLAGFSDPDTGNLGFFGWNTLALELGMVPVSVAFGPSMDFVAGCDVDTARSQQAICADDGPYLGADLRFSTGIEPVTVWLAGHPTFYDDGMSVAVLLGAGFQN